MIDITLVDYRHFGRCLRLSNNRAEALVPLDFGLRIIRYARAGGANVFFEQAPDQTALDEPDGWKIRGGHRLWLAPESTNVLHPDNDPITWERTISGVRLIQSPDPRLNMRKEMILTLSDDSTDMTVTHRITNLGNQAKTCALWAITAMCPGGIEIIPFTAPVTGMAPNRWLSFWDYTNLADERLQITEQSIILKHRPIKRHFKLGLNNYAGEADYYTGQDRFHLSYSHQANAEYPDNNVSYETFTCPYMTEMETLSPLMELAPGQSADHIERWSIFPDETYQEDFDPAVK